MKKPNTIGNLLAWKSVSSPHHCVGFLFFALHPPLLPHPAAPPALTPPEPPHHSTPQHSSQHNSSHQLITPTHHTNLSHSLSHPTPPLTLTATHHTALSSHHAWLSHELITHISHPIIQLITALTPPHHTALITAQLITPLVVAAGLRLAGRSTQSLLAELLRTCAAAGCRVAGAVHRASWRSCSARGRRWAAAGCRLAGAVTVHRASWRS